MQTHDGTLSLSIKDNGIGFDEGTIQRGNGLGNLRLRAANIGGTLDIVSRPGEGTTIVLNVRMLGKRRSGGQSGFIPWLRTTLTRGISQLSSSVSLFDKRNAS